MSRGFARRRVLKTLVYSTLAWVLAPGAIFWVGDQFQNARVLAEEPKAAEDANAIPEPEDISLPTEDGLALKCTWYPGSAGKKSVPVILVHAWDGQRTDLENLARHLQSQGHAVIAPDLRGHGESTRIKLPGGAEVILDRKKFTPRDLDAMVSQDMQVVKRFLTEKNNAGDLNIDMLCVVGVEFGAMVAAQWAVLDLSWPQLPTYKVGRDIKALVLISPVFAFKGATIARAFNNTELRDRISLLLVAGKKDPSSADDLKRIHQLVKRSRVIPTDPEEVKKSQNLFLVELDTSLKGAKLLRESTLSVEKRITGIITLRLTNKAEDFPWAKRERPGEN